MTTMKTRSFAARTILLIVSAILAAVLGAIHAPRTSAATNISATTTEHWVWNDIIQWINLHETDSVIVSSAQLAGYASSSAGDISLDCATTRIGDVCGTSDYKVFNDGAGNLSGWGWNDVYGWFSFCGGLGPADCPDNGIDYRVRIDPVSGIFTDPINENYAWNDVVGWTSFNCDNVSCPPDYYARTSWIATSTASTLASTTFDTGYANGVQLNSVLWQGTLPGGTYVRFQFATSNSSGGPWTYKGPDGTANTHYTPSGPNASLRLDYVLHSGQRYFRYRVTLVSNQAQTQSPQVDSVAINWSP
jgi:hypothetical protein